MQMPNVFCEKVNRNEANDERDVEVLVYLPSPLLTDLEAASLPASRRMLNCIRYMLKL